MKSCYLLLLLGLSILASSAATAAPYTYLSPGFDQQVYAAIAGQVTSFAFAPNGDIWALRKSPNALVRIDAHATQMVNGTALHPISQTVPVTAAFGDVFIGVANHPNGSLYLAAMQQMAIADATTGAILQPGAVGSCGGWQATASPTLPYHLLVASGWGDRDVDPSTLNCTTVYAGSTQFDFHADSAFDPATGMLLSVAAVRVSDFPVETYRYYLMRFSPNYGQGGAWAELPVFPTGVAPFQGLPHVIVGLVDGTLVDVDFSASQPGPVKLFASGGFPLATGFSNGGIVRVGPDGALYALQPGTRYDDGTVTSESSIVRISEHEIPTQATTWGKLKASYR